MAIAWQAPLVAVSVANAMLFWLFVQALFDDDFRLQPWHGRLWLAVAGLSLFNCMVMAGSASVLAPVSWGLQRALPLVFAVLAAVSALHGRQAEPGRSRRRLRRFIVVAGTAYTVVMLLARLATPTGSAVARHRAGRRAADAGHGGSRCLAPAAADADRAVSPTRVVAGGPGFLPVPAMRWGLRCRVRRRPACPRWPTPTRLPRPTMLNPQAAPPPPLPPPDAAEQRLAVALQRLMDTDRAYRPEDLTLAALASRLGVPEYRLRRLINQRLGHRNFNAYVNGWLWPRARAALADPARRDRPVLSIALEAGFQSIGPFNRAFKRRPDRRRPSFGGKQHRFLKSASESRCLRASARRARARSASFDPPEAGAFDVERGDDDDARRWNPRHGPGASAAAGVLSAAGLRAVLAGLVVGCAGPAAQAAMGLTELPPPPTMAR